MSYDKHPMKCHTFRMLCFLTALVCCICSCAAADGHIMVECSISGYTKNHVETFDLFDQDGNAVTVSTLLSDFAVTEYTAEKYTEYTDYLVSFMLFPDMCREMDRNAAEIIKSWICRQDRQNTSGLFSGSLFEQASLLSSCEFPISVFSSYLNEIIVSTDQHDPKHIVARIMCLLSEEIRSATGESDPQIRIDVFDEGRYCTLAAINKGDVVFSVSADLSAVQKKEFLMVYKENGRYCFADYQISFEEQHTTISSSFKASDTSYYSDDDSFIIRSVLSAASESDTSSSFLLSVEFQGMKEPVTVTGNAFRTPDGHHELNASVMFLQSGLNAMDISAYTETLNRPVSFSDKKNLNINIPNEYDEIRLAICSGVMLLAAEIIPSLPAEYQNLLVYILLQ